MGMLSFLVRNIWENNNILSERFTLVFGQDYFFKKSFLYLLLLAASVTCSIPLDLGQVYNRYTTLGLEHINFYI